MKLLSTLEMFKSSGRVVLDLGKGVVLDLKDPPDTTWFSTPILGPTTGFIFIRRKGDEVHMMFNNVNVKSSGTLSLCALPVGFQPKSVAGANWRNGSLQDDAGTSVRLTSYYLGNMRLLNAETGKNYGGYINFITGDPWPASIPGVLA